MKKKLISVIMGIYNVPTKKMLEEAINSILNQSYGNIEFIIIDDNSTNNTYKWAKEITEKEKRVVLIKNETNIGLTKTLNKCLEIAKGEYIARMDHDDISHSDRLEKQYDFLNKNKNIQLVGCNINKFDKNGIWGKSNYNTKITKNSFLFNSPFAHPTIFGYKTAFDAVNGYREAKETDHVEDYDLFMRMYINGIKMANITEPLYEYREDEGNYKRRKYKYRINEAKIRAKWYKKLRLYPKGIIYVIKPLIVGLIPAKLIVKIKKKHKY